MAEAKGENISEISTKACSNCKKLIEVSKIRLHEVTCARNTYKCPKCDDVVAKSMKDQHEFEHHEVVSIYRWRRSQCSFVVLFRNLSKLIINLYGFQVQCEYCKDFESERTLMSDHQQYCHMKPKQCKFCELVINGGEDEYYKHLSYCGSKTKECEVCGFKIMAKELEGHIVSGQCDIERELKEDRQKSRLNQDL